MPPVDSEWERGLPEWERGLPGWERSLRGLCDDVRERVRSVLGAAFERGARHEVDRPIAQGAGDVTFGLDRPAESAVGDWFEQRARLGPLSLLTEESGWRHRGPGPDGAHGDSVELGGFDHGGPRVAIDPVDGTRNLMADLRPAWTALACCPPGPSEPRLSDVTLALLSEIPERRSSSARMLVARVGAGARIEVRGLADGAHQSDEALVVDDDDRPDHGYFPFFCFDHAMRPAVTAVATEFFARLEREEGARSALCLDDQYICNAGQLALLAAGTYRMIADLRSALLDRVAAPCTTSKPYDCAAAILIAREAGCVVTAPDGSELDFPLDASTPVGFVGWANHATHARLSRHLRF